ncbi:MAG: putative peptidoglycan glycosyltransferase FtsW [bacterium]
MNKPDYLLIFLIIVFVAFGFLMLSSATAFSAVNEHNDAYFYVKSQLRGLIAGLILFWIFSRMDYRVFKKYGNWILGGTIMLLLLVLIPGIGIKNGTAARSWIGVPFAGSFQPSELAKLGLILFFSAWLEFKTVITHTAFKNIFIKFSLILGAVAGMILLQPDMGTAAIVVLIAMIIYFVAGAPLLHFGIFGALAAAGSFVLIKMAPYKMARFTAFLNPSVDPQGIGYHINQALLAIGSGRLFGVGLGQSLQKLQYLPEVSADSIFAIIGEELGFLFAVLFVAALILFLIRGLKAASGAPDFFGKILATGITGWIVVQAFINIGGMLAVMPMTGVPLPFVSAGGTALLATLAGCGILVNISRWS